MYICITLTVPYTFTTTFFFLYNALIRRKDIYIYTPSCNSVFYLFKLPFPPFLIWRKICNKDAEGLLQAIAFKFKFSRAIDSMSLARSSNTPLTAIVHFRDLAVTFRPRKLCRAESHRPILDSNDRVEWLWPTSKYRCEYQWSSYLLPFFFLLLFSSFFSFFFSLLHFIFSYEL